MEYTKTTPNVPEQNGATRYKQSAYSFYEKPPLRDAIRFTRYCNTYQEAAEALQDFSIERLLIVRDVIDSLVQGRRVAA